MQTQQQAHSPAVISKDHEHTARQIQECTSSMRVSTGNGGLSQGVYGGLTCALVPPIPNELTLILSAFPRGHGIGFTGTVTFFSANGTAHTLT